MKARAKLVLNINSSDEDATEVFANQSEMNPGKADLERRIDSLHNLIRVH